MDVEIKFMFEILNFSAIVPYRYVKFHFINHFSSDEKAEMRDKAASRSTFFESAAYFIGNTHAPFAASRS